jgi:hypothetical protein
LILSIDPGLRGIGAALFAKNGYLERAAYIEGTPKGKGPAAWLPLLDNVVAWVGKDVVEQLVVELPQVYTVSKSKGDPNDLIQLAAIDGCLIGAFRERFKGVFVQAYLPAEWKGQVKKEAHHERIKKVISEAEVEKIKMPVSSLAHNVWDAVALGLFAVNRCAVGGAKPRPKMKVSYAR